MAKLLIIDDERGIRNTLREILTDEGHDVEVAENGKTGLEMAQKKAYDLIFSDIKMPEMDGMELLSKIVESRKSKVERFFDLLVHLRGEFRFVGYKGTTSDEDKGAEDAIEPDVDRWHIHAPCVVEGEEDDEKQ